MHLRWQNIGHHGDDALAAQCADGDRLVVVAGPDGEIFRTQVHRPLDGSQIAGCLLDAVDIRVFGQRGIGLRRHGHSSPGGNVIEDHGDFHCVGNGEIVAD